MLYTKSKGILCLLLLLLSGCAGEAISQQPPASLPASQLVTGEESSQRGRSFKLKLTLTAPEDLKVREGDRVQEGQMLADRTRDRERLEGQQKQLQLQVDRLKAPIPGPPPPRTIPEMAALPAPSFLKEVAEVDRVRLKVEAAERNLTQQQRKLDVLQTLPANEIPEATIPHEQEVLAQRQREVDQANADLALAQAQLGQAQQERQYQEYLHSLELSKRAISIQAQELQRQDQVQRQQAQERERSFQLAQLDAQMQQLNAQLLLLSAIRSPYNGNVQRIKFTGQSDQNLMVELVLVVAPDQSRPGSTPKAPATQTPDLRSRRDDSHRNRVNEHSGRERSPDQPQSAQPGGGFAGHSHPASHQ
ncbi:hypothetical protein [Leptolyngbya sp. 'hensonii']|uniref:hypothetical protein n=1 Tax=Leptolyngbya sp. 'hensonii' TaxID=1922337 RepID=UPI0009F8E604|nr:hypothetical protein [Leptolyngbya sp. 'hensonii']